LPAEVKITKEKIVEAAFKLVRKEGIEALSARKIAGELNCSTQPVYSSFKNMKEMEEAVIKKAADFVTTNYFLKKMSKMNFLNIGLGYVNLAREERELFKLLYLSGRVKVEKESSQFPVDHTLLIESMRKDEHLKDFDDESLSRLLKNMWIYTHGLTAMVSSNPDSFSEEFVERSLREMGQIVVEWEVMNKIRGQK